MILALIVVYVFLVVYGTCKLITNMQKWPVQETLVDPPVQRVVYEYEFKQTVLEIYREDEVPPAAPLELPAPVIDAEYTVVDWPDGPEEYVVEMGGQIQHVKKGTALYEEIYLAMRRGRR